MSGGRVPDKTLFTFVFLCQQEKALVNFKRLC
jgi:hypothetical protein